MAADGKAAKRAAFLAILKKVRQGKKLTAADLKFITSYEAEERAAAAVQKAPEEGNAGATLEEDLEEWTKSDGVVRGYARRLSWLASIHQVERGELDKILVRVQRGMLAEYGFDGAKRTALSGNETLALQWVRSIHQLSRSSAEWSMQMDSMEQARRDGARPSPEEFALLVQSGKQLAEQRNQLALKIRELAIKERKTPSAAKGSGRGVTILVNDREL